MIVQSRVFSGLITFLIIFVLSGCQTTSPMQSREETGKDVQEALSAVAGALSGKSLSKEEIRDLEKQIRTDEGAQTAIQAITEAVGGTPVVKYCPITGQRYAPHFEVCPEHGVELKRVGE